MSNLPENPTSKGDTGFPLSRQGVEDLTPQEPMPKKVWLRAQAMKELLRMREESLDGRIFKEMNAMEKQAYMLEFGLRCERFLNSQQ